MPHECTNCGHTFPDGSKEMLSGCPDCGGTKFQYSPATGGSSDRTDSTTPMSTAESTPTDSDSKGTGSGEASPAREWTEGDSADASPSEPGGFEEWPESARRPEDRSAADSSSSASTETTVPTSSEVPSSNSPSQSPPSGQSTTAQSDATVQSDATEDTAQASARSDVVNKEELPAESSVSETPPDHGRVVSEPSDEQPSIEELRAELNDQFESIKIVSPGQYELNLMELYNREEHIISLQEDGRYVINVPDSWHKAGDE